MILNLAKLSTPQLKEIRRILVAGVPAYAEAQNREYLCHKSPPAGYPKEKSEYGDPECYRYPLNTKARCLAAWRYVHHADNKAILGKKFGSVESKIKRYAKEHYKLDLEVGESEDFIQTFMDYYDSETMGERCDSIVLENEVTMENDEKITALDKQVQALASEKETLVTEKNSLITEKASLTSQIETMTKELNTQKEELETLRKFKSDTEKAAERAKKLTDIKAKLVDAGIEANLDDEAEANYWLNMSDENFKLTISKMVDLKKGAKASASIKVPPLSNNESVNTVEVVRTGLKKMKEGKK